MDGVVYSMPGAGALYDALDWPFEFFRYRRLRPRLWRGLSGRVLDLGAGTGRNVPFYPEAAAVNAVDLSPAMLARAARRVARCGGTAECAVMDARRLEFPAASFDACVSTFLFCVLPDEAQRAALAEVRRVLKPGGRLRLLEYVYSQSPVRRLGMRILSPLVERVYGARFDRRTREHLAKAGFQLDHEEFVHGDILLLLAASRPWRCYSALNHAPKPV